MRPRSGIKRLYEQNLGWHLSLGNTDIRIKISELITGASAHKQLHEQRERHSQIFVAHDRLDPKFTSELLKWEMVELIKPSVG